MFNGHHLTELMQRDNLSVVDLVKAIGWSSNRMYYQFLEGNPTAKTLFTVSEYFSVPVDYFFDRDGVQNDNLQASVKEASTPASAELYERLLKEKDKRISTLEKMLSILEGDKCGTK